MRHYLGVHYQGEIHTLTVFDLAYKQILEANGGFLPPFVYRYHFAKEEMEGDSKNWSDRYRLYQSWPKCKHGDGCALGAFRPESVQYFSQLAVEDAMQRKIDAFNEEK